MQTTSFDLPVLSETSAPQRAQPRLKATADKFGFLPNLLGVMAHAPALLEGYLSLGQHFDQTSLSPTERQIVLLAASAQNGCDYCMAAHTVIAGMQRVDADVVDALRTGRPLPSAKHEALRAFAVDIVERRGRPSSASVQKFFDAGYTKAQALEVVLGVGMKTLSNYTNHLVGTPLDAAFAEAEWQPADAQRQH